MNRPTLPSRPGLNRWRAPPKGRPPLPPKPPARPVCSRSERSHVRLPQDTGGSAERHCRAKLTRQPHSALARTRLGPGADEQCGGSSLRRTSRDSLQPAGGWCTLAGEAQGTGYDLRRGIALRRAQPGRPGRIAAQPPGPEGLRPAAGRMPRWIQWPQRAPNLTCVGDSDSASGSCKGGRPQSAYSSAQTNSCRSQLIGPEREPDARFFLDIRLDMEADTTCLAGRLGTAPRPGARGFPAALCRHATYPCLLAFRGSRFCPPPSSGPPLAGQSRHSTKPSDWLARRGPRSMQAPAVHSRRSGRAQPLGGLPPSPARRPSHRRNDPVGPPPARGSLWQGTRESGSPSCTQRRPEALTEERALRRAAGASELQPLVIRPFTRPKHGEVCPAGGAGQPPCQARSTSLDA
jgi:hypothetical protein